MGAASVSPFLTSEASASSYEHVVDIVEAGADNSGGEPIDDVFREHANDDTLIQFPSGRYRVNHLGLYDLTHFAMVGEDATLFPGNHYDTDWIAGMAKRDVRIENFTIDTTEEGVAPQVDVNADDNLVVRNIYKRGTQDDGGVAFGFHTNTESGTALIENLKAADGGECVGLYIQSDGPVTVRNCHLEGYENNGLYASVGSGAVRVEGGTFRNNNVAQVRLGAADSYVRGAEISVDRKVPADKDTVNMRGIRISDGPGPVTIENCDIRMTGGEGSGAIVGAFDGGSFDVRDTDIHVGENYTTIGSDGTRTSFGIFVDTSTESPSGARTVENVSITGGGTHRSAILLRRGDNTVRNCCINQSGRGRNGFTLENCSNNTVADTVIDVSDEEFRMRDSSARRRGNRSGGACEGSGGRSGGGGSGSGPTGEVGRVEMYQSGPDEWRDVGFTHRYKRPVAVGGPVSYNGTDPCHLRVADVGGTGCDVRIEEWMYLDGIHETERVDYLVVDAGTYYQDDIAMEVGYASGDDWFRSIAFDQDFDRRPVVLAQPMTYNGPNPVVTRLRNVSDAGAEVLLVEEEGESHGGDHRRETVGYVALEPGSGQLYGQPFEVHGNEQVTDEWHRIEFDRTYNDPRFVAGIQTYRGGDPANLRYRNLDGSSVEVFVEEEQSETEETDHVRERVGALVIEGE